MRAMTVRKFEWLTFGSLVAGLVLAGFGVGTAVRTASGTAAPGTWVGVVVLGVAAVWFTAQGIWWTPAKVTIDDTGIRSARGPFTRMSRWRDLDNLWVAKRADAVSLVSSSAPRQRVHPWDWIQARRLGVAPHQVIGSIRADELEHVEKAVRRHGRRELPVVYQH